MEPQQLPSRTGVALLSFAIGIVVSLVGLIVNSLVITPLSGVITLLAAIAWIRQGSYAHVDTDEPLSPGPTAGPAPRALDRYQFSIRNGHLWLERLYSVCRVDGTGAQARIHAFALKGTGEPATGPESWLYPLDPS
jgi:hypothetical protein